MNGLDLAIGITRSWTATYTRGLPHDLRAERREEIDSDLWDHQRLADLEREPVTGTAAHVLFRLLFGMPADLLWRIEAGSSTQTSGRTSVNDTWFMRIGLAVSMLLLFFLVLNGVGIMLDGGGEVIWGLAFAVCPLVSLVGLSLCRTRPKLGVGLVVAGVVSVSLIMFWMAFVTVPVGLVIIAFAIRRSGLSVWPFNRTRPSATGTA